MPTQKPTIRNEIVLDLPNRPGELHRVTEILAKQNVNIEGVSLTVMGDRGTVRFVPHDAEKTRTALKGMGLAFREKETVLVPLKNAPGELDRRLTKLAQAGINVEALYPTMMENEAAIAFEVPDATKAREILGH